MKRRFVNVFVKDYCTDCESTKILDQIVYCVYGDDLRVELLEKVVVFMLGDELLILRTA